MADIWAWASCLPMSVVNPIVSFLCRHPVPAVKLWLGLSTAVLPKKVWIISKNLSKKITINKFRSFQKLAFWFGRNLLDHEQEPILECLKNKLDYANPNPYVIHYTKLLLYFVIYSTYFVWTDRLVVNSPAFDTYILSFNPAIIFPHRICNRSNIGMAYSQSSSFYFVLLCFT